MILEPNILKAAHSNGTSSLSPPYLFPVEVSVKHLLSLALLAMTVTVNAQTQGTVEQKFVSGGLIRMHLESGGYTIRATDSTEPRIVVTYHVNSESDLRKVKVEIHSGPSTADVEIRDTPNNNFQAEIEVPRRSNLWVRLTAGKITVDSIDGDKDLGIRAGQLEVEIPNPDEYGHREASVWTGSIDASAFGVNKGGLFRSFDQPGPGKYRLRAHVMSGEIDFRESDRP